MFKGNSQNVSGTSLKALKSSIDSTLRPYSTLIGQNLGNSGLVATIPMEQFYRMSAVANEVGNKDAGLAGQPIAQRKLDPKHAFKLAVYMLRGLLSALVDEMKDKGLEIPHEFDRIQTDMGKQPYFALQPIVVNVRTCGFGGDGLRYEEIAPGYVKVYLSDRDILWVVDGQHRRYGMDMLFDFLDMVLKNHCYPKRGPALYLPTVDAEMSDAELTIWKRVYELAKTHCTILLDVHLGLKHEQERQLFHDLNNLGKKVEASLAFEFDESNPINLFIKEQLINNGILGCEVINKDVTNWHEDAGGLARKDVVAVNARLLLNKTTVSGAQPQDIVEKLTIAKEFWEAASAIPNFGVQGAKKLTVAAQPVVLKAIAKLAYDFAFGREKDSGLLDRLFQGLEEVDFSHSNAMWRYYQFTELERDQNGLSGLTDFLPSDETGANRDIGGWDDKEQVMRFGAKSNDIYPIIGDMIRWKLSLPNRQRKAVEAEAVAA